MEKILMHKNIEVARLAVRYGKIVGCMEIFNMDHMPVGTHTKHHQMIVPLLQSWQSMRTIPDGRDGLADLIHNIGAAPYEAAIRSRGLSLTDCYWFKDIDEDLRWEEVSFAKKGFSSDVSGVLDAAKENSDIDSICISPDFSTDGMLKKTWVCINGIPSLVKAAKLGFEYACANEVIASRIADLIGVSHVPYFLLKLRSGRIACICPSFIPDDSSEYVCSLAYSHEFFGESRTLYERLTRIGLESFLQKMIAFDLLIGNTDRHEKNFGFLRNPDTLDILGPAPLFDSGLCLQRKFLNIDGMKPFGNDRASAMKYLKSLPFDLPGPDILASIISDVYVASGLDGRIQGSINEILENREELIKYVGAPNE